MTHFEDFDKRKAVSAAKAETGEGRDASLDVTGRFPLQEEERRLLEALWAINRAILDPDEPHGHFDRLKRTRDEVWDLGVDLYGWTD